MTPQLVVRSTRVVTPETIRPAAVHIADGVITAVAAHHDVPVGVPLEDVGDAVVMPGLVDTHVHINQPGRTEWEGFETATRAAAAGGVTTLVEMPLNASPPTTTVDSFKAKVACAAGKCFVDVGFWGGLVPGNMSQLRGLLEAGAFGFKCFLAPSGVDQFPHVTQDDLRAALPVLARLGAVLLAHAELPRAIRTVQGDPRRYANYLASRPREAENEAVTLLIGLCRTFGARIHVVHLSSGDAVAALREARVEGLPITVETCPHYLHFAAEEIPDGRTAFKCAPPIRERANRGRLWDALREGVIPMIVSDHSPCPPELKCLGSGDFASAWGGIASLELGLSVVWKEAGERGYGFHRLAQWMCQAPARLAGLEQRKGAIAPGRDADLVVWEPEAEWVVEPARLRQRHKLTPYAGARLPGLVQATLLRGQRIYDRGGFAPAPSGTVLLRTAS